ncbi:MAG: Gfo/Idh/MocA family oxidoreductase [Candidatus Latescibacteria bacterium]|nr:Gfo/Idh/MocA family oxidoreductase [Candidatus Latescibacterota bacterium]
MKIAIIGTGGIAHYHARAIPKTGAELWAICDVSAQALEGFGDEYGVERRYSSVEEMLAHEGLDIAIVSTWGVFHARTCDQIARSRRVRAILCEKPFCTDASEAREMIRVARDHQVLLAEAFKFRHHPQHLKAKELVEAGRIGPLQAIRSTFTVAAHPAYRTPAHNWRFDPARGGGAIYDLGCYNIHHARFIAGTEPVRVYACAQWGTASGVEESVAALLEFPGGLTAQLSLSFRCASSEWVELHGEGGLLRYERAWNVENHPRENHPAVLVVRGQDGSAERYEFPPVDQFALQLRHLIRCLETGEPHRIPPENSLGNMQVIDALFASMKSGQPVTLSP